jgi:hypothetical protein
MTLRQDRGVLDAFAHPASLWQNGDMPLRRNTIEFQKNASRC